VLTIAKSYRPYANYAPPALDDLAPFHVELVDLDIVVEYVGVLEGVEQCFDAVVDIPGPGGKVEYDIERQPCALEYTASLGDQHLECYVVTEDLTGSSDELVADGSVSVAIVVIDRRWQRQVQGDLTHPGWPFRSHFWSRFVP